MYLTDGNRAVFIPRLAIHIDKLRFLSTGIHFKLAEPRNIGGSAVATNTIVKIGSVLLEG